MIKHKTVTAKGAKDAFRSRHAKEMAKTARKWLAKVEEGFALDEAAELTDDELKRLVDAEFEAAKAQGTEASLIAAREVEEAVMSRVQKQLDKRQKNLGKRGGKS